MTKKPNRIPEFRKKVASFLSKEDGKINKEKLIKAGIFAVVFSFGVASASRIARAEVECTVPDNCGFTMPADVTAKGIDHPAMHKNAVSITTGTNVQAQHNHCVSRCHSSHGSNPEHSSHGSCGLVSW